MMFLAMRSQGIIYLQFTFFLANGLPDRRPRAGPLERRPQSLGNRKRSRHRIRTCGLWITHSSPVTSQFVLLTNVSKPIFCFHKLLFNVVIPLHCWKINSCSALQHTLPMCKIHFRRLKHSLGCKHRMCYGCVNSD